MPESFPQVNLVTSALARRLRFAQSWGGAWSRRRTHSSRFGTPRRL